MTTWASRYSLVRRVSQVDRLQLSSSDTDLHFLHLSSVQVHIFSPQAHRCSHDSLWDLSSLDHTRGPRCSLPVSWGRFHLSVQDLSLGHTAVRRQFQGHRRRFLQFPHPLHFTLILEGLLLHQIWDMQGQHPHLLQLLTLLRRQWPAGATHFLLIPAVLRPDTLLAVSLQVDSEFSWQHTLLLLCTFC